MTERLSHTFMEPEPLVYEPQSYFTFLLLSEVGQGGWRGLELGVPHLQVIEAMSSAPVGELGLVHVPWGLALFHRSPLPCSRQKSIFLHIYCGSLPGLPEVSLTALCSSYDCDSLEFSAFTAVCPEAPASCQFSLRCSYPGSGFHSRFGWWVPSQGSRSSLCMRVSAVLGTSLRPGSSCLLWSQREFSLVKMEGWLPSS